MMRYVIAIAVCAVLSACQPDNDDETSPTPPETQWQVTPAAHTTKRVAEFQFSGDGDGFECAVNGGPFQSCTSPWQGNFDVGVQQFSTRAIRTGVVDASPAHHQWQIHALPETRLQTVPNDSDLSDANFVFDGDGSGFECALDAQPFSPCQSPLTLNALAIGTHQFRVRAMLYDGVDDSPAEHQWRVLAPAANKRSGIGLNLTGLARWATEWVLVDAFHMDRRDWRTSTTTEFDTNEQAHIQRDPNGWPTTLPSSQSAVRYRFLTKQFFADTASDDGNVSYPAGDYTVLYDGEGELAIGGDAVVQNDLSQPGRLIARVTTPTRQGIFLRLLRTDPNNNGNYLRNIRLLMPGYWCSDDAAQYCADRDACAAHGGINACVAFEQKYRERPFHPRYLADLKTMRVLRFMQFMSTINNPIRQWSQRTQLDQAIWVNPSDYSPPLELAPMLGNAVGADIWLTMPVRVDDDYWRQAARLIKAQLAPNLRVYIEHGNEIWNFAWPYVLDRNVLRDAANARWGNVADENIRVLNYHGMRTRQLCDIWREEWGSDAQRVHCVLGAQNGNVGTIRYPLACALYAAQAGVNNCAQHLEVAIAPYVGGYVFSPAVRSQAVTWLNDHDGGLNAVFEELTQGGRVRDGNGQPAIAGGALAHTLREIDSSIAEANRFAAPLIAYEGGQHLAHSYDLTDSDNRRLAQLILNANRDIRMHTLYLQLLDGWRQRGGGVFTAFESTARFTHAQGAFAWKEHPFDDCAPKFQALQRYALLQPCWWQGCER